ncbi:putative serine/threonine protein kinase [Bimuria novae-zelandiae CBS 107.79]|uniref:Putative serine/threonine protein kinase n=1 Tax=Bimuria novae-zelandiae CBS 107.79 TaxID=1447943 RepID=A0A6A5UJ98_9PLEO|nr:putative serine/threonine protein kinase [Bimuria novae-zelandiae CBS 107.79]
MPKLAFRNRCSCVTSSIRIFVTSLFRIGQVLKGSLGKYTITKEIQSTVWFAKNQLQENVVIKSVRDHPRVENERDVLKRFQHSTPHLHPLIDEIEESSQSTTMVLKHLDTDLWQTARTNPAPMNRKELKYVSRAILEALSVLHGDGFVHTDVKPGNVFVNLRNGEVRFSGVQLGDLGGCSPIDSWYAATGAFAGTAVYSSPEQALGLPWNTASDIWSFGATFITLLFGGNFTLFEPKGFPRDHEDYNLNVVREKLRSFAPFTAKFGAQLDLENLAFLVALKNSIDAHEYKPFRRAVDPEVWEGDREFVCKMMKLDWRDRLIAKEILEDG